MEGQPNEETGMSQITITVSLGLYSMVNGFTAGYTGPAFSSMEKDTSGWKKPTNEQESWIASLLPLGAFVGSVLGGVLAAVLGRRMAILATTVPIIFAYLLIALAVNIEMIMISRLIVGLCIGIISMVCPLYVTEVVSPKIRGRFGLLPTVLGNAAIMAPILISFIADWRVMAYVGAVLPIIPCILMLISPESPYWYIRKGKIEKAQEAFKRLKGDVDIEQEIATLKKLMENSKIDFRNIFTRSFLEPLSITLMLMFFQQASGINVVIYYSSKLFDQSGSSINGGVASFIMMVVNLIATLVATGLIDKAGRKLLMYTSNLLMIISLTILGLCSLFKDHYLIDMVPYGWLPLSMFLVYVSGFSSGAGPIPWLMIGEIIPSRMRALGGTLPAAANWIFAFAVTKTFFTIQDTIGSYGAFWTFAVFCVLCILYVKIFVPETAGRSLKEIEQNFTKIEN